MFRDLALIEASIARSSGKRHEIQSAGVRNIMQAMIVAEDRRFCRHHGVDIKGVVRAIIRFFSNRGLEGASTIEQQLVRTVRGRYEITLSRKLSECLLAMIVSFRHDKAIIAYSYLDVAYFGWRANGVRQAAQRLGVELLDATEHEAAAIAAMLKVPMPRFPSQRYITRHSQRVHYISSNWNKVKQRNGFTF